MNPTSLQQFIQKTFPTSKTVVETIASQFSPKTLLKNEFLLKENTVSNEYFFLESGFLRAFTYNSEGEDITTNFFFEQRMVFEVSSLFLRVKSLENIQALTETHGFFITFEQLNHLFHTVPEFREFGRTMLVREFTDFKQRTLKQINSSAETRYLHLLETKPEIFVHAPLKHIASYLGITDTSLSRIRKEFAKKTI